jgi:hypothetical protein
MIVLRLFCRSLLSSVNVKRAAERAMREKLAPFYTLVKMEIRAPES